MARMSASAISRQLTRETAGIFGQLSAQEFDDLAWSTSAKEQRSPHVVELIQRFKATSSWVVSAVLQCSNSRDRASQYAKFVDVLVVR